MKIKNYYLVYFIVFMSCTYAQENIKVLRYFSDADSIEVNAYSFFPMQNGNFWQYASENEIINEITVTKDSVLENNSKLFWINNFPTYLIDTNYTVLGWHPSGEVKYMDNLFKLDSKLGEEWYVWRSLNDSISGYIRKVESVFEAEYFGMQTVFKEVVEYARDANNEDYLRHKYLLGAGLGIVNKKNDSMTEPPEYLLSAIIDGDTLGTIVGIEEKFDGLIPNEIELYQNYPNPFNPATVIRYSIPSVAVPTVRQAAPSLVEGPNVSITVYNILGKEVTTLVNENKPAGNYEVIFDASGLSSGVYFIRLESAGQVKTVPALLLK